MVTVTCIIPSLGTGKSIGNLEKCISSLNSSRVEGIKLEIIVISNHPKADIGTLRKKVKLFIKTDDNFGYARMNNLAIEQSILTPSDYFLLINDDAWVDSNFLKELLIQIKKKSPDIIVPLIFTVDNKKIDSFGVEYFKSGYAKNNISFDIDTQLAAAACLLIKSSFLRKVKKTNGFYFNPILHSYLEDVEFSIRARALGATISKNEKLIANHLGSATYGKRGRFSMYHTYRNIIWLIILTWPKDIIISNLPSIALVQGWVILYSLVSFGPGLYLRVIFETIKNFKKLTDSRAEIVDSYNKSFKFSSLFSNYAFRTYHGKTIRIQ